MSYNNVIARSLKGDAAIFIILGLLRYARNDGEETLNESGENCNDSRETLEGTRNSRKGGRIIHEKRGYIYLMTNKHNTVIYTGVTSHLVKRIYQHKKGTILGFTQKYNIKKLVYYEITKKMETAIEREKQIKAGSRKNKINLIKTINPTFKDLYPDIVVQ